MLAHKFYQEQFHSTLRAWAHDREDLLVKTKATFADAWAAYEEAEEKAKSRKKQENICQELYKKVKPFTSEERCNEGVSFNRKLDYLKDLSLMKK